MTTSTPRKVYPRVCGGTLRQGNKVYGPKGLSPRVRGNRPHFVQGFCKKGSIPACAGEPRGSGHCGQQRKVYPRVCGGTTC